MIMGKHTTARAADNPITLVDEVTDFSFASLVFDVLLNSTLKTVRSEKAGFWCVWRGHLRNEEMYQCQRNEGDKGIACSYGKEAQDKNRKEPSEGSQTNAGLFILFVFSGFCIYLSLFLTFKYVRLLTYSRV